MKIFSLSITISLFYHLHQNSSEPEDPHARLKRTTMLVLSLNRFHAFSDKEAAYREIYRILRG